jgi:hypothetical protein
VLRVSLRRLDTDILSSNLMGENRRHRLGQWDLTFDAWCV